MRYDAVRLTQLIPVEESVIYQLSYLAWGNPGGVPVTFSLQRDVDPWETYGLWQDIELPASAQRFIYRFTCLETDPQARFSIYLGMVNGSVGIADLRLEKVTCDQNNMVANPSFDCDPDWPTVWNWWSSNPQTRFVSDSQAHHGAKSLKITNLPSGAFYDAAFTQPLIPWTANRFYLSRPWAKGVDISHDVTLSIKDVATNETPVWLPIRLTSDWQPHPFVFRPRASTDSAAMTVFVGELSDSLWFDEMQLEEIPMPDLNSGAEVFYEDVTGDHKADCIYVEMRDRWYVWVARGIDGEHYSAFELWATPFAPPTARPVMGNFADQDTIPRADLAMVEQEGVVIVRLSNGTAFIDPGNNPWQTYFWPWLGKLKSGDVNGDGLDDIVDFTRREWGDVFVSLSTDSSFTPPTKWHDWFAPWNEMPDVGDFNGDGKDDIVTFTRANEGYVIVSYSNGSGFGQGILMVSLFCIHSETPGVGDINGDGKDHILAFVGGDGDPNNWRVWGRHSTGNGFGPSRVLHEYFCGPRHRPTVADLNGDGMFDAVAQDTTSFAIIGSRSWGSNFGDVIEAWNVGNIPTIPELPEPNVTGIVELSSAPTVALLDSRVYPTPFRGTTTIAYHLPGRR